MIEWQFLAGFMTIAFFIASWIAKKALENNEEFLQILEALKDNDELIRVLKDREND